jgi:hypothetical protein
MKDGWVLGFGDLLSGITPSDLLLHRLFETPGLGTGLDDGGFEGQPVDYRFAKALGTNGSC